MLEELGPVDYAVFEWPGEQPVVDQVQPLEPSAAVIVGENRFILFG